MAASITVSYTLADLIEPGRLADDTHGPARRTATYRPADDGPAAEIDVELRGRAAYCSAVRFTPQPDGRGIHTADLARLPLDRIISHVLTAVTVTSDKITATLTLDDAPGAADRAQPHARRARQAARRQITDADLDATAKVYRAALAEGRNTAQAVAEHFDIAYRTAGHRIARARAAEKLGRSLGRGRPGEAATPTDPTPPES